MDPFIGGALISGATSLLGGLFGRSSAKKDLAMQRQLINEQNEYNNPTNIRKRAEDAGFNPLSFIGPGVGLQSQTAQVNSGNYMGAAIADAGMAFAGAMADKAKFAETKKLNDLEMANAKLQNKLLQLTLRPKVGGVYAQRETTPTIAAAVGGGNAATSGVGSSAVSGGQLSNGVLSYGGIDIATRSDTSDAAKLENRWGDVGGSIAGLGVMAADLGTAFRRYTDRKLMESETNRRQALVDAPPVYGGRGSFGMPRRSQNAMGWGY